MAKQVLTKKAKSLGAYKIGWWTVSGKFVAREYKETFTNKLTGQTSKHGQAYGYLRFGKEKIVVTEKEGEYIMQSYKQEVKKAKTKEDMKRINEFFKQYVTQTHGKTGILLENISKEAGIKQVFEAKLKGKLDQQMSDKFDNLAKMVMEINKDRHKAELFYADTQMAFKQVANKYQEMQSQGGVLDDFQMQELEDALDKILRIAETYMEEKPSYQMNISSYSDKESHTIVKAKTKKKVKR